MIKLLALDMDGTLLTSDKRIAPAQIEAIHKAIARGVRLVLCTGRNMSGMRPYFDQLGLDQAAEEYVILLNGCATYRTKDWSLIDQAMLSVDEVADLLNYVRDREVQLSLFDETDLIIVDEVPSPLARWDATNIFLEPLSLSLAELKNSQRKLFQAMYIGEAPELDTFVADFGAQLSRKYSMVRSQDYLFEAMPKGVTKATGLANLVARLGLTSSEVMAVGDADNDLEMLAYAGLAIGMGNATPAVRAQVDDLTDTNDRDGVAKAITKYLL